MGLMDWILGQFIDVIEWTDETSDTMVWRFPRDGNEIKYGAKLIVRESQVAIFVDQGRIADVLEPGTYELETKNLPLLTSLQHWDHGFKSPFKAEVYFVSTKRFTNQKWGTKNPITIRDKELDVVRLRAFGVYEMSISEPQKFLVDIVGTDGHFTTEEIDEQLSSLITSKLAVILGNDDTMALDMAANYDIFGKHMTDAISPYFEEYGLKLIKITVENISMSNDVEKAIDKRTSRAVTGDLDEHLKYQTGEAIGNSDGTASDMIGMGAGLAAGQQMMNQQSNNTVNKSKAAPSMPPPPPDSYFISIDGKADGPHGVTTLKELVSETKVTKLSYVWSEQTESWVRAGDLLPELFD